MFFFEFHHRRMFELNPTCPHQNLSKMKNQSTKNKALNLLRKGLQTLLTFSVIFSSISSIAQSNPKTGLNALLTPDNCVVMLIDHQPFQFAGLASHSVQTILDNTVTVAKTAKIYKVPTLLTTVIAPRGGLLIKQIQDVYPDQVPIDRTFINAWEDKRVTDWIKKSGKKKIVMAGLWTEVCVAMPAIQALGEGYEVYVVADACGGINPESHQLAMQRMIQAGAVPITFDVLQAELQRDWARTATAEELSKIILDHGGALGTNLAWEIFLLNQPRPTHK
jgi:nicotinamidase-related amidase